MSTWQFLLSRLRGGVLGWQRTLTMNTPLWSSLSSQCFLRGFQEDGNIKEIVNWMCPTPGQWRRRSWWSARAPCLRTLVHVPEPTRGNRAACGGALKPRTEEMDVGSMRLMPAAGFPHATVRVCFHTNLPKMDRYRDAHPRLSADRYVHMSRHLYTQRRSVTEIHL